LLEQLRSTWYQWCFILSTTANGLVLSIRKQPDINRFRRCYSWPFSRGGREI
jgi:hypothetical protein